MIREKITEKIEVLGYSQNHCAKQIGMDRQSFGQFLKGSRNLPWEKLEILLDYLELELNDK